MIFGWCFVAKLSRQRIRQSIFQELKVQKNEPDTHPEEVLKKNQ